MRKDFIKPFLENIDRKGCNDGSRELISVFHNPHQKGRFLSFGDGSHLAVHYRGALLGGIGLLALTNNDVVVSGLGGVGSMYS